MTADIFMLIILILISVVSFCFIAAILIVMHGVFSSILLDESDEN